MSMDHILFVLNRLLGRETVLTANLLGQPLRLSIQAAREIRRVHEIHLEAALLERMFRHIAPGDTVYDVGANIGLISLLLADSPSGAGCAIHSFEPESRNFGQLSRNIALNGLSGRIVPHRLALGSVEGEARLFVRGGAGEGRHSIAASRGSTASVLVPITTADAFARSSGTVPDVVKIDVEGAEGHVLAGMETLLGRHRPRELFVEIHTKGLGERMPDGRLIPDWLKDRGYSLAWEQERRSDRHCHYR